MSRDPQAAQELVRRSGQLGVPVIIVDDTVVVGFDQARLERLLAPAATAPKRFGATVAAAPGGVRVGEVRPGSTAERAGLRPADLILSVDGQPVTTPEQLQRALADPLAQGRPIRLRVRRAEGEQELRVGPPYG